MRDDSSTSRSEPAARFSRTVDLLGAAGFARLAGSRVAVIGLGGVGSHAALALARAGVGHLRLVDFDAVTESSLNRHAVALPADVGQSKAAVLATRLAEACPHTRVEPLERFCDDETVATILAAPIDCLVDAIDSLNPKVGLLAHCVARGLTVVSSMGASSRTDPSLVRVGPLSRSRGCPLAKQLRKRLRNRAVPLERITAVYSTEPARPPLPPERSAADNSQPRGRERGRQPSLSTLPGIFGYAAATAAILALAGDDHG